MHERGAAEVFGRAKIMGWVWRRCAGGARNRCMGRDRHGRGKGVRQRQASRAWSRVSDRARPTDATHRRLPQMPSQTAPAVHTSLDAIARVAGRAKTARIATEGR